MTARSPKKKAKRWPGWWSRRGLPSASSLTRLMLCPESDRLEHVLDAGNVHAEKGTTTHAFLAALLTTRDPVKALAHVPEDSPARRLCEQLCERIAELPEGGSIEPAFAYDPVARTSRILGYDIGREYLAHGWRPKFEFPGTADCVGLADGGRLVVILDWKTGHRTVSVRVSWQMKLLARAAATAFRAERARVIHGHLREGEAPFWDVHTFEGYELDAIGDELERFARDTGPERTGVVQEGDHCRYCPAWKLCPAKTGLLRHGLAELAGVDYVPPVSGDPSFMIVPTPEKVAAMVLAAERMGEGLKRLWAELEAYAEREPLGLVLGDGRVMVRALGQAKEKIARHADALAVVEQDCDAEARAAAATTSKDAIEEAVRLWAKRTGRPIGKSQEAVLEHVRKVGAIQKFPGEAKVRIIKAETLVRGLKP